MKKFALVIALLSLLLFGCGKKKQKAPDLNTDNIEETVTEDTLLSSDNSQNYQDENQTETTDYNQSEQKNIPKQSNEQKHAKKEQIYGDYAVQIISLTNYDKILKIKRDLADEGYETELTTFNKNGKIFYRLRLKEKYTKKYAEKMGKEVKNKFKFINSYWIQKIK